jgi:Ion channel
VFRRGRVTYHRIVGAVLLYLLIAIGFAALFAFVGLSIPNAFKGVAFEDDAGLASELFYLSFVTLTTTGYGDIVPLHPLARVFAISKPSSGNFIQQRFLQGL